MSKDVPFQISLTVVGTGDATFAGRLDADFEVSEMRAQVYQYVDSTNEIPLDAYGSTFSARAANVYSQLTINNRDYADGPTPINLLCASSSMQDAALLRPFVVDKDSPVKLTVSRITTSGGTAWTSKVILTLKGVKKYR
jgi:hypothetical protein